MDAATLRETILAARDSRSEPVDVPEWGVTVYVRSLTSGERDRYEQSIMQLRNNAMVPKLANARAKLVVLTTVDEKGAPVFSDGDLGELATKSAQPIARIFDKAQELAGLSTQDLEELVGNSGAGQPDGSSSDSPVS